MKFLLKLFLLLVIFVTGIIYFVYDSSKPFKEGELSLVRPFVKKDLAMVSSVLEKETQEIKKSLIEVIQKIEDGTTPLFSSKSRFTWVSRFERNTAQQWQSVWIKVKEKRKIKKTEERNVFLKNIYSFLASVNLAEGKIYVLPLQSYKKSLVVSLVSGEKGRSRRKTVLGGVIDLSSWDEILSSYKGSSNVIFLFDSFLGSLFFKSSIPPQGVSLALELIERTSESKKDIKKSWQEELFTNGWGGVTSVNNSNIMIGAVVPLSSPTVFWRQWEVILVISTISFVIFGFMFFSLFLGSDSRFLVKLNKVLKKMEKGEMQTPLNVIFKNEISYEKKGVIFSLKGIQNYWVEKESLKNSESEKIMRENSEEDFFSLEKVEEALDGFSQKLYKPMVKLKRLAQEGKNINRKEDVLQCFQSIERVSEELIGVLEEVSEKSVENEDEYRPLSMLKLANSSLSQLSGELTRESVKVKKVFKDVPDIKGDVFKLQTSIVQVLQNSIEAMGNLERNRKKEIVVRLYQEGKNLHLLIEDVGVGISPENRKKVFVPFYSNKQNHLGLGMSSVLSVVRAHGGEVQIESKEGNGSKVHFIFPILIKNIRKKSKG